MIGTRRVSKLGIAVIAIAIAIVVVLTYTRSSPNAISYEQPKNHAKITPSVAYNLASPNFRLVSYNGTSVTINNYGSNVTVKIPAGRIIADNTVAMQILIDIGASNNIIGIEGYAAKLPFLFGNLTKLPTVSSGMWKWNYELMAQLSPDVVIEWAYGTSTVRQKLQPFEVPVVGYGAMDNLTAFIYYLGLITNRTNGALSLINFIDKVKNTIGSRLAQVDHKLKAYVMFSYGYSLWYAAGNTSSPYWAVLNAGLQPCFNKSMQVEPSAVLSCNPDVIVVVTWDLNPHWTNATQYCQSIINTIRSNSILNATNAVKNNKIIVIPGYLTQGPPIYIVSLYIASKAYPQAFAGVDPEYYLNYYFTNFLTTAEPGGVWWCSS